ncbi:MAG TPA: hypothetical protein VGP62_24015 [Bryobacteraceae bacterium]|jgi:hypothetical protein|nr:hypothetical protein [Bryobacteraceae bacterium]
MHTKTRLFTLITVLCAASAGLHAQDLSNYTTFQVDGRTVQIHGFVSQGFLGSNDNNYLTTKSSDGSFAFTDFGVNISTQITDKFRVGAQFYDRNLGNLGNWHPQLDWAMGDYKFADWFGVRAGKVKTVLGLFNDTQDMEFLHTWAILPQSMYPLDLRASTIAHTGGDVYGNIRLKKFGDLSYTGYAGLQSFDKYGGYVYGLVNDGLTLRGLAAKQYGVDLRWNNLLPGLLFGVSYLHAPTSSVTATIQVAPTVIFPFGIKDQQNTAAYYGEYKFRNLTLDGEYRRQILTGTENVGPLPAILFGEDGRGGYASAAYRVSKRLELGTYHSRFYPLWPASQGAANHMFDTVATAKIDLVGRWDLKIEGHFMDGYGTYYSFRGFYPQDNPAGLKPRTNLLVIRTGWNF